MQAQPIYLIWWLFSLCYRLDNSNGTIHFAHYVIIPVCFSTHYFTASSYTSGSYSYSISAEVGLLTRNVKIIGGDYSDLQSQSFGGRILVGDYFDGHQQWTGGCIWDGLSIRELREVSVLYSQLLC